MLHVNDFSPLSIVFQVITGIVVLTNVSSDKMITELKKRPEPSKGSGA
jgi:hypothetical protein